MPTRGRDTHMVLTWASWEALKTSLTDFREGSAKSIGLKKCQLTPHGLVLIISNGLPSS